MYIHPSVESIYASVTREMGIDISRSKIETVLTQIWEAHAPMNNMRDDFRASDQYDREKWKKFLRHLKKNLDVLEDVQFERWFENIYQRFGSANTFKLYDETVEVLEKLKEEGYQLGIVSNWDSRLLDICREKGLTDYMEFVLPSAIAGFRKPSRKIFDQALSDIEASPEEVVHIGDRFEDDCVGALKVGVNPIYLERGTKENTEKIANEFDVEENVKTISDLRSIYEVLGISEESTNA